jgi:ubiquinone/menaquinone biosynthesis C-methylase UbiE
LSIRLTLGEDKSMMVDNDELFTGSIPELYDTYLVPLIFEGFARDLALRTVAGRPLAILEIAAGSGVVARALAPQLGEWAHYVVTDLNRQMLDHARVRQGPDSRIEWRAADAAALPFADRSFDKVCCQFGAMFFADRIEAFSEARRILKPGGAFVFNVWDRIEDNLFADLVTSALAVLFPVDPPRFLARTPHGYADRAAITADLREAGFTDVVIETVTMTSEAPAARHPAMAYCMGTPLRNEIESRDADALGRATDHAEAAIARVCGLGPVSGKIQGHVVQANFA